MEKTFGEMVYTRCGPGYTIRGEALPQNNGYAVFSISRGLFDRLSDGDAKFADNVIAKQFVWALGCPEKYSCSWLRLPKDGRAVFTDLYAYTEEDQANSSKTSNTRGSHVAQMLVADGMDRYPFELMGSPWFEPRQKSSTDIFYPDACTPRPDPIPQSSVPSGPVTAAAARAFAAGRMHLVQAGVVWLMQQMRKSPEERKPLLILDTESNIRLWIAAITSCFPVSLACGLTFHTMREGLSHPAKAGFYAVSRASGEYMAGFDIQNENQVVHPLAVMLGCSVNETDSASRVAAMPESSGYCVLNGRDGTIRPQPDEKLMRTAFVAHIASDPARHDANAAALNTLQGLTFLQDIPAFYDHVDMIRSGGGSDAERLAAVLRELQPYAGEQTACVSELMNRLIYGGEYGGRFIRQDALKGYPLLVELTRMSEKLPAYARSCKAMMTDVCRQTIAGPGTLSAGLAPLWGIAAKDRSLAETIAVKLVAEEDFACVNPDEVATADEKAVSVLLDLQAICVARDSARTWDDCLHHPTPAFKAIILRSLNSEMLRSRMLKVLSTEPAALDAYVAGGAVSLGESKRNGWWEAVIAAGYPADSLLRLIHRSFTVGDAETVLVGMIKKEGYGEKVRSLYAKYLMSQPNAGTAYARAALNSVLRGPIAGRRDALKKLLDDAGRDANTGLRDRLCAEIDSQITLSEAEMNEALSACLLDDARCPAANAVAYRFLDGLKKKSGGALKIFRGAGQDDQLVKQWEKGSPGFAPVRISQDLAGSGLGKALLQRLADASGEPAAHLLACCGFSFANPEHEKSWMKACAALTVESDAVGTLCQLYTVAKAPGRKGDGNLAAPLRGIVTALGPQKTAERIQAGMTACEKVLAQDKKTASRASRLVSACEQKCGAEAAAQLKVLLDGAVITYEKNHQNDRGGLFGFLRRK